jgi:hypothetical protein
MSAPTVEYQRERFHRLEAEAADYEAVTGTLAAFEALDSVESVAPNLRERYLLALLRRDARIWKAHFRGIIEHGMASKDEMLSPTEAGRTERVAKSPEPWLSAEQRQAMSRRSKTVQAKRKAIRTPESEPETVARPILTPQQIREQRNLRRVQKRRADRAAGIPAPKRTKEQNDRRNVARKLARATRKAAGLPRDAAVSIATLPALANRRWHQAPALGKNYMRKDYESQGRFASK